MKTVLLIGAGKSASVLISYLIEEASRETWKVIIADANQEQVLIKTNHSPLAEAVGLDVTDDAARSALITRADIVISMMPPALHYLVAKDCVTYGKHLLTASYLDEKIKGFDAELKKNGLLFLCEMGLDPGIDHMSAMKLIEEIKHKGGAVTSFKSHCGGLVAPESDDNPWHYKISWNPRNVVLAGKAGAEYKLGNQVIHKDYKELFRNCNEVLIGGLPALAFYPNRDSLSYAPVYGLESAADFVRTTLRYPDYCRGWQAIVAADLTNDVIKINTGGLTFTEWSKEIVPFVNDHNRAMLEYLGLFSEALVPANAATSADILQYLLESKWVMQPDDKDMIVMLHEIEYKLNGVHKKIESSLVVIGENSLHTAMAKTVGMPLGIAAKLILNGTVQLTGVHIPTCKEIYEPVLNQLESFGIRFSEREK